MSTWSLAAGGPVAEHALIATGWVLELEDVGVLVLAVDRVMIFLGLGSIVIFEGRVFREFRASVADLEKKSEPELDRLSLVFVAAIGQMSSDSKCQVLSPIVGGVAARVEI